MAEAFFQKAPNRRAVKKVGEVKVLERGVGVSGPRAPVGRRLKKGRRKARSQVDGVVRSGGLHRLQAEPPVREPLFKEGGDVFEDHLVGRVVGEVDEAQARFFNFEPPLMEQPRNDGILAVVFGRRFGRDNRDAAHFPGVFLREPHGKIRVGDGEAPEGGRAQHAAPVKGGRKAADFEDVGRSVAVVGFREPHARELKPRPEGLPARADGVDRDLRLRGAGKIGGDVVLVVAHLRQQAPAREKNEGAEGEVEDDEAPEERDDVRPHPRMPQKGAQAQRQYVGAGSHDRRKNRKGGAVRMRKIVPGRGWALPSASL